MMQKRNSKLQVLMPMAGLGSRFANAGYSSPKPLIEVDGMPMFIKALSSLQNIKYHCEYFFVIRKEHVKQYDLDQQIKKILPEAHVVVIPKLTRGAAESAFQAEQYLSTSQPLLVMDCDIWFQSNSFNETIINVIQNKENIDGCLLTFKSNNPRYSYLIKNTDEVVTKTAEKNPISNHAVVGAYFFSKASSFKSATKKLLKHPLDNKNYVEYYISLLYNILIDEGKKIKACKTDSYRSFGTPEELEYYKSLQKD